MSLADQIKLFGAAEVIVILKPATAAAAAASKGKAKAGPVKNELKECFVKLADGEISLTAAAATRGGRKARGKAKRQLAPGSEVRVYENLGVVFGTVDQDGLEELKSRRGLVAGVHLAPQFSLIRPVRRSALGSLADAALANRMTWGLHKLGVGALRAQGLTGRGVLVGHLDTGVDGSHPGMAGAIAHFAEFDFNGNEVPGAPARDSDEHGTHTAGTIAGRPVNGLEFGVAPEAKLASAMVIEGGSVIKRILAGMDWAVGREVRILSMSLGLRGFSTAFLPLTRILRQRNILPVFAVGNEGVSTSRSPGNYAEALSVGAGNVNDRVADFSSSQRFLRAEDPRVPDLVAPGVDVASSIPGGAFASFNGTSMATPHVAGLAALLMQAKPQATADQVEEAIFDSCRRPTSMTAARANRGVPNGPRAVQLL